MVTDNMYKIQYRVMMSRYRGRTVCPTCRGMRLKPEAEYVKICGKSITDLVAMPVSNLHEWFANLQLTDHERMIGKRLLAEINSRLHFLVEVGLGYLTLNRMANTLSGGESQRINLTTQLGSSLVGSLYVLDEPSIGLHSRDTDRLISVLRQLRDVGNTVVVVEHDEEIMRSADYLIDVGPDAGRHGGEIVYEGCPPPATTVEHEHRGEGRKDEQSERHRREISAERAHRGDGSERLRQVVARQGNTLSGSEASSRRGGGGSRRIQGAGWRLAADKSCGDGRPESYRQEHPVQCSHIRESLRCNTPAVCATAAGEADGLHGTVLLVQCRWRTMRRM